MSLVINTNLFASNSAAGVANTGILSNQPSNPNFLSPLNFKFSMTRSPNLNFFVVRATLPDVSLTTSTMPTPFRNIPLVGNKLNYKDLEIVYRVDENFNDYLELYTWMTSIGHLDNFTDYNNLAGNDSASGRGIYSDATLTILDSNKNPNISIEFHDVYPVALGELWFNAEAPSVVHVTSKASFKFREFTINQLTNFF